MKLSRATRRPINKNCVTVPDTRAARLALDGTNQGMRPNSRR